MKCVNRHTGTLHSSVCNVQRMATTLIGLIGKKQSGKDTFANRLVAEHGFTRLAFADPLKDLALALDPLVPLDSLLGQPVALSDLLSDYSWDEAKEVFPEVRLLLQQMGVAVRDTLNEDTWVQALAAKAYLTPGPVVITDTRFINEARWIRGQGGECVRILRPGLYSRDKHISETALDSWVTEHRVINDGTVADLQATVDRMADDFQDRGLLPQGLRFAASV